MDILLQPTKHLKPLLLLQYNHVFYVFYVFTINTAAVDSDMCVYHDYLKAMGEICPSSKRFD